MNGAVARGRWSEPHEVIVVRGYEDHEKTVRHEMLYDLLAGDPTHADEIWSACDLLLGCAQAWVHGSGPWRAIFADSAYFRGIVRRFAASGPMKCIGLLNPNMWRNTPVPWT